ncbi:MAG: ATP-binding protein [Bdellovibrionales bacterium]
MIHLTILLGLIFYQFLFSTFIHPYLSISVYSLSASFLLLDSLYLFFYKDNKLYNNYLNEILIFLEACFFIGLFTILGIAGISFILFLVFLEVVALRILRSWFSASFFSFLIYAGFIISMVWQQDLVYEDRKAFVVLLTLSLFLTLSVGQILNYFWKLGLQKDTFQAEDSFLHNKYNNHFLNSLSLSRKIKPALNLLYKTFSEIETTSFPKNYKVQLNQLQKFVNDYVDYAEVENYVFQSVQLPKILERVLKESRTHEDRPDSLKENLEYKSSIYWLECCEKPLEKSFKNIIENSLQALKNEKNPWINIRIYDEKSTLILEFIDNGCGIEDGIDKDLFDPFFSDKLGVRGVGLAYVLKTIKAHKGRVDISSSPQQTKVRIELPLLEFSPKKISLTA